MDKKVFTLDFRGRRITVESGQLAKQANGAALVKYADTAVLATSVMSKNASTADFFPLTINYLEKLYSVGKIPGGFIKREGRPTESATLAARMIDRPMRPLFPENFRNEVQIVNTVLSVDPDNSPEMTAMFGSSLATCISKVPFDGPIAGVKVGRVNGEFIINPTVEELEQSDIELTVAGTKDAINMVEAGAKQVSEEDMLEALMFGHEAVKELCELSGFYTKSTIPHYHNISLWTHWFPFFPDTFGGYLFFYIWPLLAALPYGWSYYSDKKTEAIAQIESRCSKKTYCLAKMIACFISGGAVIALPLLQNLLIDALFCPVTKPDPANAYPIINGLFLSKLFYTHPWYYAILWCFMNFLFGGTTALLCLVPGSFPRYQISVVLFPMAFYLLLEIIYNIFLSMVGYFPLSIAPLHLTLARAAP